MIKLFKVFAFTLAPIFLYPCLWLEGTTIDGEHIRLDNQTIPSLVLQSSLSASPSENFRSRSHQYNNHTGEYKAIKSISTRNYSEAINTLLEIEREVPNRYETASNLGTAYELNGNLPLAIKWITEGVKRNADSHLGTEWLHILILKTKVMLQENPLLLKQKHIIPLPKEFDKETVVTLDSSPYTISKIRTALLYQLKERMIFVKPKSPIVADLLYSFAKIEEQTTVVDEAEKLLQLSIEYGFSNKHEIEEIHSSTILANTLHNARIGTYCAIGMLLLVSLYRFEKRRASIREATQISPLRFAITVNLFLILSFLVGAVLSMIAMYELGNEYVSSTSGAIIFYVISILCLLLGIKISLHTLDARCLKVTKPFLATTFTVSIYSTIVLLLALFLREYRWVFPYVPVSIFIYFYLGYKLNIKR